MPKWPVARATPAELFNALGHLKFVKEEIILPFGSPKYVLRDNDLNFDCNTVEDELETKKFNGNIRLLIAHAVMVLLSVRWAQSSEHYRGCPGRIYQNGTCALIEFYAGTADVQVLMVNAPSKFCTVSSLDFREKTKLQFNQVLKK